MGNGISKSTGAVQGRQGMQRRLTMIDPHPKASGKYAQPKFSYLGTPTLRVAVPDDQVLWQYKYPQYQPAEHTDQKVLAGPVWADPEDPKAITDYNTGARESYVTHYKLDGDGRPLNPIGRTGMRGRGLLGKWGPNHAADPVVTRWKGNDKANQTIEFVAIQRRDTQEWAFPGGMVDKGDTVSETLKKEFLEETQNILDVDAERAAALNKQVEQLFQNPTTQLYAGYIDDPRNTDNSWMESTVTLFHDESGELTKSIELNAGDDAQAVQWISVNLADGSSKIDMYASHAEMLDKAVQYISEKFAR